VSQAVRRGRLVDSGITDGLTDGTLHRLILYVMAAGYAGARIDRKPG